MRSGFTKRMRLKVKVAILATPVHKLKISLFNALLNYWVKMCINSNVIYSCIMQCEFHVNKIANFQGITGQHV